LKKERLDKLMVARGLAESRTQAQAIILAGNVFSAEKRLEKPGQLLPDDIPIALKELPKYVSRGGLKLEGALKQFNVDPRGRVCLDIGASTGGFTDCLLQHGAERVVAVDVGYGQLDWKIRQNPRVEVREKVNARHLSAADFDSQFDLIVIDVSFISLTRILPAAAAVMSKGGEIIALIKPQFEVGRSEVGKGGIVRDSAAQARVVTEISEFARNVGLSVRGTMESPILGADGNREFLAHFSQSDLAVPG
jgi:23S rRNA (cytidine1920-2'-O)/16S rRNA (cytidine1409-2'-O)-methyltransferase